MAYNEESEKAIDDDEDVEEETVMIVEEDDHSHDDEILPAQTVASISTQILPPIPETLTGGQLELDEKKER